MTATTTKKDGFEVRTQNAKQEVVHFVACDLEGSQREKVLRGMLRNMDTDKYIVADTRDEMAP